MKSAKKKSIDDSAAPKLNRLSDQVAASAIHFRTLDGSALWALLALYRSFAILDRDQALEVSALGLTPLQFNILTTLQRTRQPTTMGALASMLVVKPNNLSGNINTLAEKGLLRRELNVADQRSLLAVLTRQGEAFLKKHLPGHWERLERLMSGLTKGQRLQMVSLLNQLNASIEHEQERERDAAVAKKKGRTRSTAGSLELAKA